jgi:hypothetical protein
MVYVTLLGKVNCISFGEKERIESLRGEKTQSGEEPY